MGKKKRRAQNNQPQQQGTPPPPGGSPASAGSSAPGPAGTRFRWRAAILVFATALWILSVFAHHFGSTIFAATFDWSFKHWGGIQGRLDMERLIFSVILGMGVTLLAITAVLVLRKAYGRRAAPELLARWTACLLCAYAADHFLICIQSECVHFLQYGSICFLLGWATGNPRLAFVLAVFGGFLDESNQWWNMYYHDWDNHQDWNDMCMNACGACAGALPWTSIARLRLYATNDEQTIKKGPWYVPLLLPAAVAGLVVFILYVPAYLGYYPSWPFWKALNNNKPYHELSVREGIPALLGLSYVFYYVVDERRRALPFRAMVAALIAVHVAVVPPPPDRDQPIHTSTRGSPLSHATIPHAKGKVTIDGTIHPEEWAGVPALELHGFAPDLMDIKEEDRRKGYMWLGPEAETKAQVQWDEKALYVAFRCKSKDVWGRDVERDDPSLPGDSVVELFLDVDAAERTYYEFDVSPANRVQDLFVYWPEPPSWVPSPQDKEFVNLNAWDCRGLQTAVSVQGGVCEVLSASMTEPPARKLPPTEGYTVVMSVPWSGLTGRYSPPTPGAHMRANLCRVEQPRPRYFRPKLGWLPSSYPYPTSYVTWAPTYFPLDFHRPELFGVWEFAGP